MLFTDLVHPANLASALDAKLITIRESDDGQRIYNYSDAAMYTPGAWDNPAVRQCRGLIVDQDQPHADVIDVVSALSSTVDRVIFLSGRDEECRDLTEAWLREHVVERRLMSDYELHMRPAGDRRRDSIVKAELFDRHVRDQYRVLVVLDDRKQVVEMWRSLGLTCLQVAEGDF